MVHRCPEGFVVAVVAGHVGVHAVPCKEPVIVFVALESGGVLASVMPYGAVFTAGGEKVFGIAVDIGDILVVFIEIYRLDVLELSQWDFVDLDVRRLFRIEPYFVADRVNLVGIDDVRYVFPFDVFFDDGIIEPIQEDILHVFGNIAELCFFSERYLYFEVCVLCKTLGEGRRDDGPEAADVVRGCKDAVLYCELQLFQTLPGYDERGIGSDLVAPVIVDDFLSTDIRDKGEVPVSKYVFI